MITNVHVPLEHQQPYGPAYGQMLAKVRHEGACPIREKVGRASAVGRAELSPTT
ncbi:hypothetical protein [Streptomyces sp. NPDC005017]|uniref:hypothetical protein n=1 Tax=Streptomyces sp. NPDC005017 TaxID=3364706 RepID=UPI0036A28480